MTIDCREVRNKLTEYQLGGLEESERAALCGSSGRLRGLPR